MMKIGISSRIMGNKPQEQIELLEFEHNEQFLKLVAYNKGNGYVKIFTYGDFIEWFSLDRQVQSLDLAFDEYNEDEILTAKIYNWQYKTAEQQIAKKNIKSVEVTALSIEDLKQLGFDTSNITTQDLKNIAYKMDLSETFWIELEHRAEKYGLKKKENTKNQ